MILSAALYSAAPALDSPFLPFVLVGGLLSLLVAAFAATVGTALLVHSPTKLLRRFGDDQARLSRLRTLADELILTARVLSVLGGTGTCACALFLGGPLPAFVTLALAALALVAVCAALPPALVATRAESIVARGFLTLDLARLVLRGPLLLPARSFARAVLRLCHIPEQPTEDPTEIAEDILDAVADHDRSHALAAEEKTWIANIVDLKDLRLSAVMTPRTDIEALPAEQTLAQALQHMTAIGHSRYPVHAGRVDEVIGLLYAKDVLALVKAGESLADRRVAEVMRKPLFVPDTMGVPDLLRQLKQAKVHIAIVLDEYGGTAGLITVEDILEEIVGDLADEDSDDAKQPLTKVVGESALEASGRARVAEVNAALLGLDLPEHDDYDTVAGYLFSRLGRIPPAGEKVEVDGVEFTVLRGDERRIDCLRLRVPQRTDAQV